MNEAKIKLNYIQRALLFLLFLAGMNFLNKYFYLMFLGPVWFLVYKRNIKVDINAAFLAILMLALMVFAPSSHDRITSFMKPGIYLFAYLAGLNFLPVQSERGQQSILYLFCKVTIILVFAPLMHFFLNMVLNLQYDLNRNTIDIWTNSALSATGQSAMTCLAAGALTGVLFIDCSKTKKYMAVLTMAVLLLYNFTLAGRTIFVIVALVFVLSAGYFFRYQKKVQKKVRLIVYVLIAFLAVAIAFQNNVFGIREALGETNFFLRFFGEYAYSDITQDTRLEKKIYYIKNFLDGFWGGNRIRESGIGYAHDIFLDTYDEAGILALIGITSFLANVYWACIKFVRRESVPLYARQIIVGIYSAVLLEIMIEPIIQGSPWLFALFCFISGMFIRISKLDFSESGDRLG